MNLGRIITIVLFFNLVCTALLFGQKYAVTSGDWDGAIWAATQGGVPGSATTPTSTEDIVINSGILVTVNTSSASCLSVTFQDSTGTFALAAGSILNVYGNFTVISPGHKAFSSWEPGAKLRFTGSSPQLLSGWSITSNSADSTILMEVVVDKASDTLRTPGTDMKIGIGTSLEIVHGVFMLGNKDDINGREIGGASTTPTIRVDTGGVFKMVSSTSAIRSGVSGRNPIGKMTILGNAYFVTTSTIGICIGGIDIENGGALYMESFSSTAQYNVKLDTVNVKYGAMLYNRSTTSFWDSTAGANVINLDSGGYYKVTTATTVFPRTFNDHGTVRYQRTAGDGSQTIADMDYHRLEISFAGNKTWTLAGNHAIEDSLEINNQTTFILTSASSHSLYIGKTLRLTSGTLNNSDANVALLLADSVSISRATGTISAAPSFDGVMSLRYTSTVSSVATGPEVPTSSDVILDFQILCDTTTVTLSTPATINGTLTLSNGILNNSTNTLTLANGASIRRATATLTAVPVFAGVVNLYYISSVASVATGYEMPSSPTALNNLQIICDTNTVTLSAPATINGIFTLSNGTFDNSAQTLTLANGVSVRRATAVLTAAPVFAGTVNIAYISVLGSVATGPELPASTTALKKLSIQSPLNVTLGADVTVTDTLELLRGLLYLGNNTLSLGSSGVLSGTPTDTSMLVTNGSGSFKKLFSSTPSSWVFPVGDTIGGKDYVPVTISMSSGNFAPDAFISVRTVNAKHPNSVSYDNYLNRYWAVNQSGITGFNCDLVFQYRNNDIAGVENQIMLGKWDGAKWANYYSSGDTINNQLHGTGITSFSDFTGVTSFGPYNMAAGWNLMSVPFTAPVMTKAALFPTAASQAFEYYRGYVGRDTVKPGVGYWLKFSNAEDVPMAGYPASQETVAVNAGWNMIGSLGVPIHVSNVSPQGTSVLSSFYEYDAGYAPSETLKTGFGYWVKVSSTGTLILSKGSGKADAGTSSRSTGQSLFEESFNTLQFEGAWGAKQILYVGNASHQNSSVMFNLEKYELPPVPPADERNPGFDVRFSSNRFVEAFIGKTPQSYPISISSSSYPVTITWKQNAGQPGCEAYVMAGDKMIRLDGKKSVRLEKGSGSISLVISGGQNEIPREFSLDQNYPNPFNPSTTIRYGIPGDGTVMLEVYNMLGQKVETLLNGKLQAGYHTTEWNAANVSSGIYYAKLIVSDNSGIVFSQVRKMALVK
jgi:hypothetical protein